jgi:Protein of unknown function DUF262/Protein of unknown function (DUF1524)
VAQNVLNEAGLHLHGIAQLLKTKLLRVPVYQRSYSWDDEQVVAFWEDLRTSLLTGPGDYFMGTLVLATEGERSIVIDGQQRLATLSILLGCIRDVYSERGDSYRSQMIDKTYLTAPNLRLATEEARLVLNTADSDFFVDLLLHGIEPDDTPVGLSHRRILRARATLRRLLAADLETVGPQWPDRLINWVTFLEQRVKVIAIEVSTEADAFLIFETINDRALDLTVADLLKNYLLTYAVTDAPDSERAIESDWLSMISAFDAEAEDDARATTFIRQFWSSRHGPVREKELYAHLKRRVQSGPVARGLISDLAVSAPTYAALSDSDHPRWRELGVPAATADSLVRLGLVQPLPLTLAALEEVRGPALLPLLHAIICWQVRGLIAGGIGGGTAERAYSYAAVAVRKGHSDPTELALELTSVIPSDREFALVFGGKAVAQSRLARYYLSALEAHLSGKKQPALVSNQDESTRSLVFVLPKKVRDKGDWDAFPKGEHARWALRLGNQTLLEENLLGEEPLLERLSHSELLINKQLRPNQRWGPKDVEKRQAQFARLAPAIWPSRLDRT